MKMKLIGLKRDPVRMYQVRQDRVFNLSCLEEKLRCSEKELNQNIDDKLSLPISLTPNELLTENKELTKVSLELTRVSKKLNWYQISLYRQIWMNVVLAFISTQITNRSPAIPILVKKSITREMSAEHIEANLNFKNEDGSADVPPELINPTVNRVLREIPNIATQN